MALFQFRKGRDEQAAPPRPAQTVEAMRRRAMHRLIGAAILVVAGVVGFPMLFDNQPRPISVDLPILIPDKNKSAVLVVPPAPARPAASGAAAAQTVAGPVLTVPVAPTAVATNPPMVVPAPATAAAVVAAVPPAKPVSPENPPATAAAPVPPPASVAKLVDAGKAQALLDGKEAAVSGSADDGSRFVVQVGAFADAAKVREVRQKVESAGLKTYTQVVETKEGSRTRVRVGPFGDKAEASRVAEKIRKLDLPVAILAL